VHSRLTQASEGGAPSAASALVAENTEGGEMGEINSVRVSVINLNGFVFVSTGITFTSRNCSNGAIFDRDFSKWAYSI